jgi:hypothetical protein
MILFLKKKDLYNFFNNLYYNFYKILIINLMTFYINFLKYFNIKNFIKIKFYLLKL